MEAPTVVQKKTCLECEEVMLVSQGVFGLTEPTNVSKWFCSFECRETHYAREERWQLRKGELKRRLAAELKETLF